MLQGNIGNPLLLLIYFLQKLTNNCLQLNSTLPLLMKKKDSLVNIICILVHHTLQIWERSSLEKEGTLPHIHWIHPEI